MGVNRLRKEDVERLLHYFIIHLEYELERTLPEISGSWQEEAKPGLLASVEQSDTLAQLERDFTDVITRLSGVMGELSQSRRYNTQMKEIRDYVAAHFLNPDLSLTLLSDKFQISPKYLSQLFKESIGQNFSDFLIGLRIEHAKQLLRDTEATVQDISHLLGYAGATSFIRVFKKITGISPGQYRELQAGTAAYGKDGEE
ncbi:HTH-type transcriptional activator Btr [compost metagenome]